MTPYNGDRTFEDLSKYIEEQSLTYAHEQLQSNEQAVEESTTLATSNPEGKVVELDGDGFAAMRLAGPVLVDFYAPWCPQ